MLLLEGDGISARDGPVYNFRGGGTPDHQKIPLGPRNSDIPSHRVGIQDLFGLFIRMSGKEYE
jgi:hypothetical protein